MLLEICAYNIQSCFAAQSAGAGRIELCADPFRNGTTPSMGLVRFALEHISIPVYPMVSPKGHYVYDDHELDIIKRDIILFKEAGCKGITAGANTPNDHIDADNLKRIVDWAYPMEVTCHKAFDIVPHPMEALEAVIDAGCARILTSGLQKTASEGAQLIARLVHHAAGRIIIMPGGSVRSSNLAQLVTETGAAEFHSSALLPHAEHFVADEREISKMVAVLRA